MRQTAATLQQTAAALQLTAATMRQIAAAVQLRAATSQQLAPTPRQIAPALLGIAPDPQFKGREMGRAAYCAAFFTKRAPCAFAGISDSGGTLSSARRRFSSACSSFSVSAYSE